MKKWYCTAEAQTPALRPHTVGFNLEASDAKEAYERARDEAKRVFGFNSSNDIKLDVSEVMEIEEVETE